LSSSGEPPMIAISKAPELEDGLVVAVRGILVDLRAWDSGSENMVLLEPATGATIRIVSAQGLREQPSSYASVGDEMEATGELKSSESPPLLFADSDDIILSRDSEAVLTVTVVTENWLLFKNDRICLCGVLIVEPGSEDVRLTDSSREHSISMDVSVEQIGGMAGRYVSVDATLILDPGRMEFELEDCGIRLRG